jgi:hypothetical protein
MKNVLRGQFWGKFKGQVVGTGTIREENVYRL